MPQVFETLVSDPALQQFVHWHAAWEDLRRIWVQRQCALPSARLKRSPVRIEADAADGAAMELLRSHYEPQLLNAKLIRDRFLADVERRLGTFEADAPTEWVRIAI
jgi:hypothetical protein